MDTPAGFVPRVRTRLSRRDMVGTALARLGACRVNYKVVPGLYCVGDPTPDSPVLVTANYKLTFDAVRRELDGVDAWLLVADTRGINVWCAAGKGLFSTDEVVYSVRSARLDEVVSHRKLILPQLGATGVAAHHVRKACGFEVAYGPVRAEDLSAYLAAGQRADEEMRSVTFTLKERAELVPVELFLIGKPLLLTVLAAFVLSGIGPGFFSLSRAWERGVIASGITILGILAGCLMVPLLLNRLPWREFWLKGALVGGAAGGLAALCLSGSVSGFGAAAMILWALAVGSFTAMNFTGSTPYTSPSGVEREMRRGIPVQAAAALIALALWLGAPFWG
ncbi:hypothetical protein GM415_17065 [Pseudodesulfovibrio cashew]|uniref:CO dehydrogenase/acetyl-CoA synthase delta subunit TIM barrel domain-containing protein n=1 Tax=Pseudodesulfovibrio cashew TaxID=2678688 RepID=A0A6I6JH08_9BACT|nr:hypothetical protein GM415_17065 [Pseudodesulfovibrio cashew]